MKHESAYVNLMETGCDQEDNQKRILVSIIEQHHKLLDAYNKLHLVYQKLNDLNELLFMDDVHNKRIEVQSDGETYLVDYRYDPAIEPRYWTKILNIREI